jgi:nitrogen fixation/metabolism regulation signal transduction histidine kinase
MLLKLQKTYLFVSLLGFIIIITGSLNSNSSDLLEGFIQFLTTELSANFVLFDNYLSIFVYDVLLILLLCAIVCGLVLSLLHSRIKGFTKWNARCFVALVMEALGLLLVIKVVVGIASIGG